MNSLVNIYPPKPTILYISIVYSLKMCKSIGKFYEKIIKIKEVTRTFLAVSEAAKKWVEMRQTGCTQLSPTKEFVSRQLR